MKELRKIFVGVPALVLVVCLIASYLTRGAMANLPFLKGQRGATGAGLVDQRSWQTIEALAPLAVSSEEQGMAREAERLADHEVDQSFAMAMRESAMETRTPTGAALAISQKVTALQATVKDDQARIDSLTTKSKGNVTTGGEAAQSDDLDMAKAQLTLDQDELADATQELARASGDKRGQIQQELTARQAAMKKFDAQINGGGQTAVQSAKRYGTLYGRTNSWFDQRSRIALIKEAKAEADSAAAALAAQDASIVKKSVAATSVATGSPTVTSVSGSNSVDSSTGGQSDVVKSKVAKMAQAHALAQLHAIATDRLQMQQQLSAVYSSWLKQVKLQHSIVTHLMLQSLSIIAFLILCSTLISTGVIALLERSPMDKRRLHTLQTIASLGIQFVTFLMILLVVFGPPSQVPTILGLATAGLTVVFQDFILAFFGWFVLMGKNGIRVGDWVEINGVGGEVVEIGLFRTALLETGNWTDKGHPTGRRVTFINNFAISGQYFNFSTTGQWMWDEITVNIPAGADTYKTIEVIHQSVLKDTEKDAELAEQEWKKAGKPSGLTQFSATPSVDMRPAAAGIDIIVRYVTRAEERFEMRNRLYQRVIDLLHKPEVQATNADVAAKS
jgi:small-conductance mechanosensitive channel